MSLTPASLLQSLVRDSPATTSMRTTLRARRDLVAHPVGAANQLCAQRRSLSYSGRTDCEVLQGRLLAAPRGTVGPDAEVHAATTLAYVTFLRVLNIQTTLLENSLLTQLTDHPDTHIYTSLPRVKALCTARLLAEIGDVRGRFPTPKSLASLAGVALSTRRSRAVTARWGCNKQLHDADRDFAGDSRHGNPWAADLYHRAIARGDDDQHAVRILGRAWTYLTWHCWKDNLSYDPCQHRALQQVLAQTSDNAA